ncbi:MAG TPA: PaaI family thioesterase [Chloroflexota bacterium]|nr:PaaI family thioesterase [Chloroflexota bacterium]
MEKPKQSPSGRARRVPDIQPFTTPPEQCFACGSKNPHGLHVRFSKTENGAEATFTPTIHQEGWPGVIHGGILVTLLDEAMAYALYFKGIAAVTARLDTRFRRAVAVGDELRVSAQIISAKRELLDVEGQIVLADGAAVAGGTGRFMLVSAFER